MYRVRSKGCSGYKGLHSCMNMSLATSKSCDSLSSPAVAVITQTRSYIGAWLDQELLILYLFHLNLFFFIIIY